MTTIIHNVCRVTSAGSSEEIAESHVDKTTRLATEDSASSEKTGRELSKHQVATHCLSHLRHRLPLINDNTGLCQSSEVTTQR
jgi:hypothetical protein